MGLFDGLFGKSQPTSQPELKAKEQLELRTKTFELVLKTKILSSSIAQVVFCIDASGSMTDEYRNGTVQSIVERLMPVAVKFDDNQSMETFMFSNGCTEVKPATPKNFDTYVKNVLYPAFDGCGTEYAPVMKKILQNYGKSKIPTFVIFITDGDNSDKSATQEIMCKASEYPIFWKFIGIGNNERFTFLEKLDDLSGRKVDNANFVQIKDINKITDEDLYNQLMIEYPQWQLAAKQAGIF